MQGLGVTLKAPVPLLGDCSWVGHRRRGRLPLFPFAREAWRQGGDVGNRAAVASVGAGGRLGVGCSLAGPPSWLAGPCGHHCVPAGHRMASVSYLFTLGAKTSDCPCSQAPHHPAILWPPQHCRCDDGPAAFASPHTRGDRVLPHCCRVSTLMESSASKAAPRAGSFVRPHGAHTPAGKAHLLAPLGPRGQARLALRQRSLPVRPLCPPSL